MTQRRSFLKALGLSMLLAPLARLGRAELVPPNPVKTDFVPAFLRSDWRNQREANQWSRDSGWVSGHRGSPRRSITIHEDSNGGVMERSLRQ